MAPVVRLCLMTVVAVGTTAFPGMGEGKTLKRIVDTGGSPYNQAFPLHHEGINGTKSDPAVPLCQQPRETGICRANIPRWYYDNTSGTCRRFTYGGCHGNDNNFPSMEHCRAACPDEVVCPSDPAKTCKVSESACTTAICPLHPAAVCFLLPCSCVEVFLDRRGLPVTCKEPVTEDTTTTTTTTSSTTTTTESTTPAPNVTTPKSGDDERDGQKGGRAMRTMVAVILTMIAVGVVLLMLSVALRKLSGSGRRSHSTTTLISGSPASSIRMATPTHKYDFM